MLFCLHTHLHPPLLKKNTRSHGSAFCCDIPFFICQHELGFQLQMALEIKQTMLLPFALALDLKITLFLFLKNVYLPLKLLCMVKTVLHSSLSLCVGVQN